MMFLSMVCSTPQHEMFLVNDLFSQFHIQWALVRLAVNGECHVNVMNLRI